MVVDMQFDLVKNLHVPALGSSLFNDQQSASFGANGHPISQSRPQTRTVLPTTGMREPKS
jgi:hypothetical protein